MGQCGLRIPRVTGKTGVPEPAEFPGTGAGKSVRVREQRRGIAINLKPQLGQATAIMWGPCKGQKSRDPPPSPGRISAGMHCRRLQSLVYTKVKTPYP